MRHENSLIEAAVVLMENEKKPYDLYQLFDIVSAAKGLSEDQKSDLITKFYTDLTTSAKFVYVGDNTWDLKANQKIELWEKDGSFYKEYTKVEMPADYVEEAKPAKVKKAKVKKVAPEPEIIPEVVPEPVKVVEVKPEVEIPVVEDKTPEVAPESPVPFTKDEPVEVYEEEVFEEFEDFDEDKYNEYMDTYEDQYKD